MIIRPATLADAAAIAEVYAPHVREGTASYEIEAPDAAEMQARMARVLDAGCPWLVAERGGAIIGYAYAAPYHHRPAYAHVCENSIYVAVAALRSGAGTALLQALCEAARVAGFTEMIAVIGDGSGNIASRQLHAARGFRDAGLLTGVGYKFGLWLDVAFMQKAL